MNLKARIKSLEATRQAKAAELNAILAKSEEAGETLDSEQLQAFDTLDGEIKQIDADLVRTRRALELQTAQIDNEGEELPDNKVQKGVKTALQKGANDGTGSRAPTMYMRSNEKEDSFQGQSFTRLCIAMAAAHIRNHAITPAQYAEKRWGKQAHNIVELLKAGVPGGGTMSGDWGVELATADSKYRGDFIEYLYSQTVYDRLPLRPVPDNVLIKGQDGAGTGYWVGEKKAIPATALDFYDVTLRAHKAAALAAISNELIMRADPSAEQLVRDGLVNAAAQRIDTTFLSASAAVSNVSPAGILNGLTPITASGEDAQSLYNDIGSLYSPFISAKNSSGLVYVMHSGLAKSISLMRNALGQREFPDLRSDGGMFEGDNVFTGDNVPAAGLILLKPSDIYKIGNSDFDVSISKEATIEMDTAPTGDGDTPAAQSANMVSMFQNEMTAFKVVRMISFAKRRASAVQWINNATYGGTTT